MAGLTFEGCVEFLSKDQLNYVKTVIEKRGFNDAVVNVAPVGQIGDNYSANVLRFSVEKDGKSFKTVGKIAPSNDAVRELMKTVILFRNEIVLYTEILPKFEELQKNAGVPENERYRAPQCYGCYQVPPNEVVLLEDLNESNFTMLDRLVTLPNEAIKMSLKSLAQYHALSFVLKSKEPDVFADFTGKLLNSWIIMDNFDEAKMFFVMIEQDVLSILENEKHKKVIEGSVGQVTALAKTLTMLDANPKYTIIHQGDCWTNNIMFKFEGDKLVDNIMIDYQLTKSGNPADDLLYLILNCTDYENRKVNYYDWLDCYYTELDNVLDQFGLKANAIYPREQMDSDLKKHSKLAIGLSVILASVQVREKQDVLDVKDENIAQSLQEQAASYSIIKANKTTLDRFKKKVTENIDSLLEWGYFS